MYHHYLGLFIKAEIVKKSTQGKVSKGSQLVKENRINLETILLTLANDEEFLPIRYSEDKHMIVTPSQLKSTVLTRWKQWLPTQNPFRGRTTAVKSYWNNYVLSQYLIAEFDTLKCCFFTRFSGSQLDLEPLQTRFM
jgi:hypothetical protein